MALTSGQRRCVETLDRPLVVAAGAGSGKTYTLTQRIAGALESGFVDDIDEICACVRRAAERKEVLSITSHDIAPDAKQIHMKTAWLEKILATASECGLAVIGFDELPAARVG